MKHNYKSILSVVAGISLSSFIGAQNICFTNHPQTPVSVGADPYEVRSGDFNNDTYPDFVTTNTNSAGVSVVLSNGAGGYLAAVTYAVGGFAPYSAAVGDADHDGDIDIAVGNGLGNNVTLLKNNGSGVFSNSGTYAVGAYPLSTTMIDLNNDNLLDIITANQTANTISVLLNTGSGFSAAVSYTVGSQPKSANAGDVDNDGDMDVVASSMSAGEVWVFTNNGSGVLTADSTYSVGYGVKTITLGDLNGDGYNDIAVSRYSSGNMLTMMNDGSGSFLAYVSYFANYTPEFSTLVDMDNDSDLDVLIAAQNTNPVTLMLNDGSGNLSAPINFPYGISGDFTMGVAPCDVNLDGRMDIAFTQFGPDKLVIRLNGGSTMASVSDANVCQGDTVTLNATGLDSASYMWAGGFTSGTPFVPAYPGGTYVVTGTHANGCSSTDSVHVTVFLAPSVNATASDDSICAGDNITLSGSGSANSFTWSSGVTNGVQFAPPASATYTVTGTDTNTGCSATDAISIVVNQPTIPFLSLLQDSVCVNGGDIDLQGSGIPLGGSYSGTNVIGFVFDPTTVGQVTITYSYINANGCIGSNTDVMTVLACVGIETEQDMQVNLYPNPASDYITVETKGVNTANALTIADMTGKVVLSYSGNIGFPLIIPVSNLNPGMYVLQLDGSTRKFIIK